MQTHTDEIADGIFRFSTYVAEVAPPVGFTFNQFLIVADDPLLFHTGPRFMFPIVRDALARVMPVESLRWITFGHIESDECGSMNDWLAAAPHAQVAHGATGCLVSINDMADRPPRVLADGELLEIGGKQVQHLDTPHVPHNWEARVLFEQSTKTLLCGDLFTHLGDGPALTETDLVGPAIDAEKIFSATSLGPATTPTIRRLAALEPTTLAVMHGSSFHGDGAAALNELADAYQANFFAEP